MLSQRSKSLYIGLFIALAVVSTLIGGGLLASSQPSEIVNKPAVPWNRQLSTVQAAVHKIRSDALLYDVAANIEGSSNKWSSKGTLSVVFYFVTSQMEEIDVTINDSDPVTTLKIDVKPRSSANLVLKKRNEISRSIETIALSPREAVSETWPYASTRGKDLNVELFPLVALDRTNVPAVWEVTYYDANSSILQGSDKISFRVDAKIGTILSTTSKK